MSMPRFAANLTMMFTEHPFLDRFAAAADAGFEAVEFLFPYEATPDEVAERAGTVQHAARRLGERGAGAGCSCRSGSARSMRVSRARSTMRRRPGWRGCI